MDAARRDSGVLVELDRIHLDKSAVKDGQFDFARAAPRYAALLRGYGVDLATPADASAKVRASRLRETLLAALEDWRRASPDAEERQKLEAVLQAAEPAADAFRQRWLVAARRRDGAALAHLASAPAVQELPVLTILNMGARPGRRQAVARGGAIVAGNGKSVTREISG